MDLTPQRRSTAEVPPRSTEDDAAIKAVTAWVHQFARTLKNCRLYDAANPAVQRFRQSLATSLHQLVRKQGTFTLRFTSDDVTFEGASLYPARSREDNLALPFHRDGVRALTFHENVEPREIDALIGALLTVSSRDVTSEEEDLVTLLWDAQLQHIDVDYVPAEGGDYGTPVLNVPEGELVPWPTRDDYARTLDDLGSRTILEPPPGEQETRSDDWSVGAPTGEFESLYANLERAAAQEVERLLADYRAGQEVNPLSATLAVVRAFIGSELTSDDLHDVSPFLSRVLRLAVREGAWAEARETIRLMRELGDWSSVTFVQELQQPFSIASIKDALERQGEAGIRAFAAFAQDLGEPGADVIGQVLAELGPTRDARPLMNAMATLCRSAPDRLTPWLTDPRPEMARAAVQILGAIGGDGIAGPLAVALRHPDPRIVGEVMAALKSVSTRVAKPMLMSLLQSGDPRLFVAALQKLSESRDAQLAEQLLSWVLAPEFEERPADERRAIYAALGGTGGDEVIPELEAELMKGGWFERVNEAHRQAIARCIARIGTPMARHVLEHGAASRRAAVRDVCRELLSRWGESRG